MIRAIGAALAAAVMLSPSVVLASPSLSPSLDSVLAEPLASDYLPETQFFTSVQGSFDAVDYLGFITPPKPSLTLSKLKSDGFVSGYGRSWGQRSTAHLLLEVVVAFSGGAGAKRWLPEERALSQNSQYFKSNITVSGIDQQFGEHLANPSAPAYVDFIGFVKGNDYFLVYLISPADDMADSAAMQAKQQYDVAPAGTIPPSRWPENASNNLFASALGGSTTGILVASLAGVVLLAVVVVGAVVLLRRPRRPGPVLAQAAAAGAIQLSADGYYWWDGGRWRDANLAAPPVAQRSADGSYWWDGGRWRTVPVAAEPPPPPEPPPVAPEPPPPTQPVS